MIVGAGMPVRGELSWREGRGKVLTKMIVTTVNTRMVCIELDVWDSGFANGSSYTALSGGCLCTFARRAGFPQVGLLLFEVEQMLKLQGSAGFVDSVGWIFPDGRLLLSLLPLRVTP